MKITKSKIRKAIKHNLVWCVNFSYNHGSASPCKYLRCPYKNYKARLGKVKELKECESFWITKPTHHFESGVPVLIHPKVE